MQRTLIALACSLAATLPGADLPWMGMWQEDSHPDDEIHFEPNRVTCQNPGGKPEYFVAAYDADGTVWGRSSGGRIKETIKVSGDHLTILSGGSGSYHRIAKVPDGFEIKPMAVPPAKAPTDARKAEISAEADKRVNEDQAVRKDPARRADGPRVDADNTAWIKTIINEVGWPDAVRFGPETASKMFLFVQHSGDMPLMLGVLPHIEKDLKAKAVNPQDYALLYDRVQMFTGHAQRYGSQIVQGDDGKQMIWLLEDRNKVEEFRKDIGLFPLAIYMKLIDQALKTQVGIMTSVKGDDDGGAAAKPSGGDSNLP